MAHNSQYGRYEPIVREGFPFIVPLALLAFVSWLLNHSWISLIFIIATMYVAWFFRNPERISHSREGEILSPADGVVKEIIEGARPELLGEGDWSRVSVFMSIFNVHVNRAPIDGMVKEIRYHPGKFLDARDPHSSLENERSHMLLSSEKISIEVVQIAGLVARRIECWAKEGDELKKGERYGLIRFGSRLDIYLPAELNVTVKQGQKVKAGLSRIAEIGHDKI